MSRTQKPPAGTSATAAPPGKSMSQGQRAYEEQRAKRAGLSLDKHLAAKERRAAEEARKSTPAAAPKKKGVLSRLLDRARRPM